VLQGVVAGNGGGTEALHPRRHLRRSDVRCLDEDRQLGRVPRALAEPLEVGHGPAVLVDPPLGIGLDRQAPLHRQPGGDDERTQRHERKDDARRQGGRHLHSRLHGPPGLGGSAGPSTFTQHEHGDRHGQGDADEDDHADDQE
jgi:hypothetical protein